MKLSYRVSLMVSFSSYSSAVDIIVVVCFLDTRYLLYALMERLYSRPYTEWTLNDNVFCGSIDDL
jgi:hypothetical protein